jgi:DNA-binding CsgD family transcriptional regulator
MSKKQLKPRERLLKRRRASVSARLEAVRYLNTSSARRTIPVQHIAAALVGAGYTSLDEQARVLGIHRATTWTIMRNKHKLGCLNARTAERMLANPELPTCIRDVLHQYATEKPRQGPYSKRRVTQSADHAGEDE